MRTYLVSVVIVTAGLWPGPTSSSAASETLDRGAGSRSTAFVHCTIFSNQAEFEAFNEEEGTIFTGVEDFEEGTLPPAAVAGMDDPLCGGIPSSPPGTPYPKGLLQLNLCVQSNLLGGAPDVPKPAGFGGIRAISAGFQGAVSDIVTSGTFVNSFDIIFSEPNHTGVGFNPIVILGGATSEVRVYDPNEGLLVMETVPADAVGSNFFGVWCQQPIGRVNLFDPGGPEGAEGADNIQMWVSASDCGACPTDVDGDGDIGPFDLAFLLGNWGPVTPDSACLDADEDGIIGPFDLAVLLGAWGPCP